jgi:hypothetical protein
MTILAGVIGLAVALGLPGFLACVAVVWAISTLISNAVESGVRRGRKDDPDNPLL